MRKRNKVIAFVLLFLLFIEFLVPSNIGNVVYAENEVKNQIEEYGFSMDEDLDENGIIDIVDLSQVASKYNAVKGEESYDSRYDFNGDEVIDIFDMVILSNKIGAEEPILLAGDYEEDNILLKYYGQWIDSNYVSHSGGSMKYSTTQGSYVEFKFYGTGFEWYGQYSPNGGKAKIYVDGKEIGVQDSKIYAPHYNKLAYFKEGLAMGEHTVRIEVLESEISIDRFVINNIDVPNNYYKVYQGSYYIGQYPTFESATKEARLYANTYVLDSAGNNVWDNTYRVYQRYFDGTNCDVIAKFKDKESAISNGRTWKHGYVIDPNGVEIWNNGYPAKANIRTQEAFGPGVEYIKGDFIESGVNITILNKENDYYEIHYNGLNGLKRSYVPISDVAVATNYIIPLANNSSTVMYLKTEQKVTLGPGQENYIKTDTLKRADAVTELKAQDGYSLIEYNNSSGKTRGYVLSSNLVKNKPIVPTGSIKKVAIDPGHGGDDPGAIGYTGKEEKVVTLAVGLKVRDLLESYGYEIVMTRITDKTLSLQERCDIANNSKADFFISIHANSFYDPSANGTETYSYFANDMGGEIAKLIQSKLVSALGLTNRGHKTNDFYVLKNTNMPAALAELAFISNEREEQLLFTESFQDKAARAIVDGILAYQK